MHDRFGSVVTLSIPVNGGADEDDQPEFAPVPAEAIQHWRRSELLTYTALASRLPGVATAIAAIRRRARIRRQEVLDSLKRLEQRGAVERIRNGGFYTNYELEPMRGRWVQVPMTVMRDRGLNRTVLLVYLALLSFADRMLEVFAAGTTLAKRAGVSIRSVYAALKVLSGEIAGQTRRTCRRYIDRLPRGRMKGASSNVYRLRTERQLTRVAMRLRTVERSEDPETAMYRAAMRGETLPPVPEWNIETEVSGGW